MHLSTIVACRWLLNDERMAVMFELIRLLSVREERLMIRLLCNSIFTILSNHSNPTRIQLSAK